MYVTGPHQRVDVRLVGLRGHGVAKEDDRVNFPNRQSRADLQIPPKRPAEQAFYGQTRFGNQATTRGTRGA